jgi:predicted permease
MAALRPRNLDVLERLALDPNAVMFAAAATLVTGLLFGLGPALSGSRASLSDVMKSGGRTATAPGHGVRALLTITQVGLALILLIGAGLLIRSYAKIMAVDPGYNADGVLAVDVSLPATRYPDASKEARRQFFDQALASIAALPGVTAASVGSMPASPMMMLTELTIDGRADIANRRQIMGGGYTSEAYFASLGIPVREGRAFTAEDMAAPAPVVVVNETFAKEFWPGESAVGKRLKLSRTARAWTTIVGVAADVKFGGLVGSPSGRFQVYFPRGQSPHTSGTFIVRTAGDPSALIPAIKTTIWALDDQLPLARIATARELLARSVSERRFNLALLGIFAACGLLLAVVGVYGVTALFVGQREREVGIRMALGATRGAVAALVLRQTAVMLTIAVCAGGTGAWLLSRYLESLVFATATTDALTFAAATAAIVVASIAATLVPLRRATSVDPAIVLRAE